MIIRRKHNRNYTVITNEIFDDESLKGFEIGTLAYLLSRPDHWSVNTKQLCNRFDVGRDKMQKTMKNLVDSGYVVLRPLRTKAGTVKGREYVIYDEPQEAINRKPENPVIGHRKPEKPTVGKSGPIVSTDLLVSTESNIAIGEKESGKVDDVQQAFDLYTETAKRLALPVPTLFTVTRRKHLTARLKDCEGLDGWRNALAIVEASAFLSGKAKGDRPFKATLDFLLQQSPFIKLLEGNYLSEIEKAKLSRRQENANPAAFDDKKWRNGILPTVQKYNQWQPAWGPAPGNTDCLAPTDIIPQLIQALEAGKVAA